ncbi:phosphomannomutase [Phlyctema vagabunda]|uniref:Phosphomannomutase n=1 Tax=Phlyctema vagabunda TaxID=108571 RepID=A0ABR4PKL6_9HELO
MAELYPALNQRPIANTICLFDVDGVLTLPRLTIKPEMQQLLHELRKSVAIGYVGGSDLAKQQEQLGTSDIAVTSLFDFCFSENGLTAYKSGLPLASHSFIKWLGEDRYKELVRFILHYVADLDIPVKRGTFVEFRNGMINVSPIGRNASVEERNQYQKYDLEHKIREQFIAVLREKFADLGLTYSIGGQISFDIFPQGWDKTYCLQHLEDEAKKPDGVNYTTIHFFGDNTQVGGNDYEIYEDPRTIGHRVRNPDDTAAELKKLFNV